MFVIAIAKEKSQERYIFLFDGESYGVLLQQIYNYAGDPELSFDWNDAWFIQKRAKQLIKN